MKTKTRFLIITALLTLLFAFQVYALEFPPTIPQFDFMSGMEMPVYPVGGFSVSNLKSSKPSVVTVSAAKGGILFKLKKPGKATVSFKLEAYGMSKSYKTTVIVHPYSNPFKKVSFAGKNYTSQLKKKVTVWLQKNKKLNGSFQLNLKKGWQFQYMMLLNYGALTRGKTYLRVPKKLTLDQYCGAVISLYNTKDNYSVYYALIN